ncbi:glyoxylate/hydroxypyruvate reductase A [Herbaspirillum sp. WKF16]|jgi:glyoxylate/hydroxypyruvate reductase A|uniref:2-hydroxyacid dehydrogenase n=1 Tax=Herbaspirillum sp. WKF16 TaxID=3028312 RepID=UPI0023A98679|nr:glyoxylate/hydroxypyruvate reductase A [Herbaspirillum sp. WKF16]WDZ94122.1 glyoxylate/hydroxypyruvate reductase A [Herbaspirillum sp. WKF16]
MTSPTPILLVKSGGAAAVEEWRAGLAEFSAGLPLEVRWWDDPAVDPQAVEYALVWQPEAGRLARYPNLKAILSSAAGVDHILADPELPAALPVVRMVTPETRQRMAEFTVMASLMLQKDMPRMIAQQARRDWVEFASPRSAREMRVGVMGLGALGLACARMHAAIGFAVAGWARSPRDEAGMDCYAGAAQLPDFLARTDILICLLPDTPDTHHIIDARLLAQLPAGAMIVNVGRGSHVHAPDLLAALDAGHIGAALLDVFEREPLPPDAPFWRHPRIMVTPHAAATPSRRERARQAAATILALRAGKTPEHVYDRERGY